MHHDHYRNGQSETMNKTQAQWTTVKRRMVPSVRAIRKRAGRQSRIQMADSFLSTMNPTVPTDVTSLEILKWVEACVCNKIYSERCIWEGVRGDIKKEIDNAAGITERQDPRDDMQKKMVIMKVRGNGRISGTYLLYIICSHALLHFSLVSPRRRNPGPLHDDSLNLHQVKLSKLITSTRKILFN